MFEEILRHLSFALRLFRRRPGFTCVVVLTLALGIGTAVTVFSIVHAFLWRPMPYPGAERMRAALSSQKGVEGVFAMVCNPDFQDWKEASTVFEDLVAVSSMRNLTMSGIDRAERLQAEFASGGYFEFFGVEAVEGRTFGTYADDPAQVAAEVVISDDLRRRRFPDQEVVGKTVLLNEVPFTIIGVLGPEFRGLWLDPVDVWLPVRTAAEVLTVAHVEGRSLHWLVAMGRLRPGASTEEADEELNAIARRLELTYPETNEGYQVTSMSLSEFHYGGSREDLHHVFWGACLVLVLCCVNVAGLLLTQATARRRETAVRTALGAGRHRLLYQLLVESLVLAAAGALVGWGLAAVATRRLIALSSLAPASFDHRYLDLRVLAVTLAATLAAGLFFGLVPALGALRGDLPHSLKAGTSGGGGTSRGGRWLLGTVAALELALALTVLSAAGLMGWSGLRLDRADPGFATGNVLTLSLGLQGSRYEEPVNQQRFLEQVMADAAALPGVQSVAAMAPRLPPRAHFFAVAVIESWLDKEGQGDSLGVRAYKQHVSAGYLGAVGTPLVAGRDLISQDDGERPAVAVVSRSFAERAWPGEGDLASRAVGQRFRYDPPDPETGEMSWVEVVGVAEDAKNRGPYFQIAAEAALDLDFYIPLAQSPSRSPGLIVRAADLDGLAPELLALVAGYDPEVPVFEVETMEERFRRANADPRFTGLLMIFFAAIALAVALVGVYGVISYVIRLRTREFGVRVALGASTAKIRALVLRQGLAILGLGLALGLFGAVLFGRVLSSQLFEVGGTNPWILGLATVALVLVSLAAVALPARRATRVDPMVVLREE